MEGEQVILESLGTPPWLARRAVLAYRQDVARAANWALDSGARHKAVHVEPQPLAPVDLQQAFDNAVDGSMLTLGPDLCRLRFCPENKTIGGPWPPEQKTLEVV